MPTITVAVAPATLSVAAGSSDSVTVTVTRSGGFAGAVAVTASGAPGGVTIGAITIPAGQTSGKLGVAVAAGAAAGLSTINVQATGPGVTAQTAAFTLTVTAAAGFSVALLPAALTVQAGASGIDTVTVARTGAFTGAVALSITGAPAGLTATLDSTSLGGARTLLHIVTTSSLTAGSYALAVNGNATGLAQKSATLTVQVAAPSASGNVSWTFCGILPIWVAVQDGSGAWTRITSADSVYTFSLTTRGGLAYVAGTAAQGYALTVVYASAQEFARASGCSVSGAGGKKVSGSVVGLGLTDEAVVSLGTASTSVAGALGGTFTLTGVPDGTVDLLAGRLAISPTGLILNKLYQQRGLNPASGSTLAPIDFSSAQAFNPVTEPVTLANRGTDNALASVELFTANGSRLAYGATSLPAASDTLSFAAIPTAQLQSGDLHLLLVTATPPGTAPTSTRFVGQYFHDPASQTVTLGAVLAPGAPSVVGTSPYLRLGVSYTPQPDYNRLWGAVFSQGAAASARSAVVSMTAGYAGAGPAALNVPDLSAAAGWSNAWALVSGVSTSWSVYGYGWSGTGADFAPPVAAGSIYKLAGQQGTITP